MSDEAPRASARRVLLRGVEIAWVEAKIPAYEELDRPPGDAWPLRIRGPSEDGWVQVDIDPGMPLYHFHNFGMWLVGMVGDDQLPDAVVLQSRGPVAVDYWLVPRSSGSSVLHGRRADGGPYAYDLAGGTVRTETELQAPAVTARLALLDRGVPLSLIDDWEALPVAVETELRPWDLDQQEAGLLSRLLSGLFGKS